MDDESLMQHLESEHPGDLRMKFVVRPGKSGRELGNPKEWRTYHNTLHRLHPNKYGHSHEEDGVEAKPLKFHEKQEAVWVVQQAQPGQTHDIIGVGVSEQATPDLPGIDKSRPFISTKTILYRPSLAPVYGGPTLLEALWEEMDRLMESLMTGQEAEDTCGRSGCITDVEAPCYHPDNGDKYRAQQLAWVLAIVTNAYAPDVDAIRAEAMRRWNEANGE